MKNIFFKKANFKKQRFTKSSETFVYDCTEILSFLSETSVTIEGKTFKLIELPWFIFIGAQESGKSSLLEKSHLEFITSQKLLTLQKKLKELKFWLTKEAIYVELSLQNFLFLKSETGKTKNNISLLLPLFKKYHAKSMLKGIILSFSAKDFLSPPHPLHENSISFVIDYVKDLTKSFIKGQQIPLSLVLTKSDLILGFKEYFNTLNTQERELSLGIDFEEEQILTHELCLHHFHHKYFNFLKNIHMHCLNKLYEASDSNSQKLIQSFPLVLEHLQSKWTKCIEAIYRDAHKKGNYFYLAGIYFTSSVQKGQPIDPFSHHFKHQLDETFTLQPLRPHEGCPFFIDGFLKTLFLRQSIPKTAYEFHPYARRTIYGSTFIALTVLVILSFYLWIQHLNEDILKINNAQMTLTQYNTLIEKLGDNNKPPLEQMILPLNILEKAKNQLIALNHHWGLNFIYGHSTDEITSKAENAYRHALQTLLLPQLRESVANDIQSNQMVLPGQLYASLKTYLMLGDPKHLNISWIEKWANDYWLSQHPQAQQLLPAFKKHLRAGLLTQTTKVPLNMELVNHIRGKLYSLPLHQLSYALLTSESQDPMYGTIPLIPENVSSMLFDHNPRIPYLYTKKGFDEIFGEKLSDSTYDALNGNWVLGSPPSLPDKNAHLYEQLLSQTRLLYLSDYMEVWQNALEDLKINQFKTLEQLRYAIDILLRKENFIKPLIENVKQNTSFLSTEAIPNQKLTELTALIENSEVLPRNNTHSKTLTTWDTIEKNLLELYRTLNLIILSKNPGYAAFELSQYRMNHIEETDTFNSLALQAESLPSPLNLWLVQLTQQSWQLILNTTQTYIDTLWSNKIYSFYQKELEERYPVSRSSTLDASFKSFSTFFAGYGMLDQFFQIYLSPFLELNSNAWTLKKREGSSLPLSNDSLIQLQRLYQFKEKFFPNHASELTFSIKLVPIAFTPDITQFNLQIDQKKYLELNKNNQELSLTFDGRNLQFIHYEIYTNTDTPIIKTFTGPWAFLRLLDSHYLEEQLDQKHFDFILEDNKHGAKYEFITDVYPNPFAQEEKINFYLPKYLFETLNTNVLSEKTNVENMN